jgi:hypothetical protein
MTSSPYWLFNEYVSTLEPITLKWQIIFGNISCNGPFLGTLLDLKELWNNDTQAITLPLEFSSQ